TVLRGMASALAVAAWPLRAADTPGYEAVDLDWIDGARERPVPVRLYLPRAASRSAPVPLVVFSHGIGGSRRGYSYLGQHFARHGVASLHLQHVGSDRNLWTGSVWSLVSRLQGAAQDAEAMARARDLSFALDRLLADDLAPRIDGGRIVAAGHSYGANTTLLASGARVLREGRVVSLRDDRVQGAIAISAPPFYGEGETRAILGAVTVPSLHITATEDIIRIPGYYSGAQDRLDVFDATGSTRKWLAVFEGGSHAMFTDRVQNPQVKAATQALTLAFVRSVFDGDESALAAWPQQHTAILARFTAP
ncbi:MAG: alpha/beta fold hydrolase, partial [Chitinophagaceae bacterium]|nr:alpha/beta fold hydrolase [Rubrivivax sp.]